MPILTLDRLSDLPAAQWNALLADAQPFVRHGFLSVLEDSGSVGPGTGWQPAHRLLVDAHGAPLAALPGYVKQHSYGEYVFDMAWAEACARAGIDYYPKLLTAVPFTPVSGGRLLGDGVAAAQLLDELSHYRAAPVHLAQASLGERRLSGSLNIAKPDDFLAALPQLLPVRVEHRGDGVVLIHPL